MAKDGEYMLVDTPDLYEYANDLDQVKNKEEFQERIKLLSLRRGIRISFPHGKQKHSDMK